MEKLKKLLRAIFSDPEKEDKKKMAKHQEPPSPFLYPNGRERE